MQRAAVYARVGTEEQARENLDNQIEACGRYGKRNGFEITHTFEDLYTLPGMGFDRPGLKELRALVTSKEVDAVIISSRDRLSRNVTDFQALEKEFEDHGVKLLYVKGETGEGI